MILEYKEVKKIDFDTSITLLMMTDDVDEICNILLSIGMYCKYDIRAEDILYKYFGSKNINIARSAILSIGHFARINKYVDKEKFFKNLKRVRFSIELQGIIEDVIDDIKIFTLEH